MAKASRLWKPLAPFPNAVRYMSISAKIAALGRLCGIAPGYWDNAGTRHRTSQETYRALLTAMGVPWEEPALLETELARRRLPPRRRLLEPVQVIRPLSRPGRVSIFLWTPTPELPDGLQVRWSITNEAGEQIIWQTVVNHPRAATPLRVGDGCCTPLRLLLPAKLAMGYYDLSLTVQSGAGQESGEGRIIVAPRRAYVPDWLTTGRGWGFNVPLYAVKSEANWGMGDFADLLDLTDWAGSLGAGFVGVNPLHAPSPQAGADPSPYSPTSRLFRNFLYLHLEMVPELAACPEAQALLADSEFQAGLQRLRSAELVAYPEVYHRKRQVLTWLYETFQRLHGPPEAPQTPRGQEFARFVAAHGESLARFGTFWALADFWGRSDWRRWPPDYQHPGRPAVAAFARDHHQEIRVHAYAQWLMAAQLEQVCRRAHHRGLPFTLYQDLALAASPGGFDTWAHGELFARGVAIGAPGDAFNPKGQNWGIPPLIPERLRESRHQFFIDTLRANLPADGMLRLDHVMGLFRLFWIPQGQDATRGAYVRYPARELLAILALESMRRRTLIIGEDLGTVPPAVRRDLEKCRVLSYRVFYFERNPDGSCRAPEDYPHNAMATVTTHDLPTLTGYWQGRDIHLKRSLHLYPDPHLAEEDAANRQRDRMRIAAALSQRRLMPPEAEAAAASHQSCPEELRVAVLEYLAQSQAALLEVRLEDFFGLPEQQNLPGTTREHPNWRRKLPLTLEEMRRSREAARLAARLHRYRGIGSFREGGQGPDELSAVSLQLSGKEKDETPGMGK